MKKLTKGTILIALVLLCTCLFLSTSYADRDSSPTAKWMMDENANDSSGNGNNGTIHGNPLPGWVSGVHRQAINFTDFLNGEQYIEVPNSASINFGTNSFSISCWFKTTCGFQSMPILEKRGHNPELYVGYLVLLEFGHLYFQMGDSNGYCNYANTQISLDDGLWHNVVITVNRGGTNRIRFYIDGVDDQINRISQPGSVTNIQPLYIGADPFSSGFNGYLDEVMLYNQELCADEVKEIFMNGNCTGKWNLDGNANDSSGNLNNGVLGGTPPYAFTFGVHNWAQLFDGADNITIPDHATLNYGIDPFSVSFWVNTGSAKTHNTVIDKRTRNGASYTGYLVELYSGRPLIQLADGIGWYNYYLTFGPLCNDSAWHFVVIRVDRSTRRVYFSIDGQLNGSLDTSAITGSITNASSFYIARHFENALYYFEGALDEIKMYNKILSTAEITEQYNCHRP
jgi:hypothetical protein